jgi:prepilin-type processing-associated H-X9-DG protein
MQIGLSYAMYQQDYDGRLPLTSHHGGLASWIQACQPYIKSRGIYRCPSDISTKPWAQTEQEWTDKTADVRRSSYFLNAWLAGSNRFGGDATVNFPAKVIYVAESREDNRGDHFHPMCWGATDPEYPACARSASMWDVARSETREISVRRHLDGANYFYLDGHARWSTWRQVYWQNRAHGVYEGNFDPRQ